MKVKPYILRALLAIAAVALLSAEYANAGECGVKLEVNGAMPQNRSSFSFNHSISQWGFMVESSVALFSPTLNVNLRGHQNFQFRYSDNVTGMRLSIGPETLYEGLPIKSYDATNRATGPLSIEFKWTGDKASIQVSDECPFGPSKPYDFGKQ